MLGKIAHRGPDSTGTWHDGPVSLGHRRLAVVDISATGAQPMACASGRYVISYNGEIYNFPELRDWLDGQRRIAWRGTSDTEILLELIDLLGFETALRRVNGMFAVAVWDKHEKALHLARDRFGEKPLYYTEHQGGLFFASELTALESVTEIPKSISRNNAALFLRRGNIPAPQTIYENIWKLPPATWRRFQFGKLSPIQEYWSMQDVASRGLANPITSPAEVDELLEAALLKSCKQRMLADVPLGAFLSGGIDSSLVVAMMQKNTSRPVKTFTIGFDSSAHDESKYARAVASHLQTDHTEQIVTASDAFNIAPKLCEIYDEPFADSSAIPTYLVSKLARQHVTVSLSGDGGDELFAGYDRYVTFPKLWSLFEHLPGRRYIGSILRRTPSAALSLLGPASKLFGDRLGVKGTKISSKIHRVAEAMDAKSFHSFYRMLMKSSKTSNLIIGAEPLASEVEIYDQVFQDKISWMTFYDAVDYLPNDILTKVDRAGMAVSLEGRMPLLDPDLFELAWRIPPKAKLVGQTGKAPLRRVLAKHVPSALFERPKMGFGVPLAGWLRGPLKPWCEDLVSSATQNQQGLFDAAAVKTLSKGFFSGDDADILKFWNFLMLQSWLMLR